MLINAMKSSSVEIGYNAVSAFACMIIKNAYLLKRKRARLVNHRTL